MKVELNAGESVFVTFESTDGEIQVSFDHRGIRVEADTEDSSGRKGVIYEEKMSDALAADRSEQPPRATELEYLTWFRQNTDFGPGDFDVKEHMAKVFTTLTGKRLPEGWEVDDGGVD